MFIVELTTRQGTIAERYESYAEAQRRVEQFPVESLIGLPMIFEALADGSQRLVREDGKPLQFHRVYTEHMPAADDAPLPVSEEESGLLGPDGRLRDVNRRPDTGWGDEEWGEDVPVAE